jgi:hypothetical protein
MSDDEASGDDRIAEDAYAAEFAEDDLDYTGGSKKRKVQQPAWCRYETLKFDTADKLQKLKDLFGPYAKTVQEGLPKTYSCCLLLSDTQREQATIVERFEDKLSYLVDHKAVSSCLGPTGRLPARTLTRR